MPEPASHTPAGGTAADDWSMDEATKPDKPGDKPGADKDKPAGGDKHGADKARPKHESHHHERERKPLPKEPLKARGVNIPPRPEKVDHADLSETFTVARQQLDTVLGEQNQRLMELKLAATQAVEQALSRLEEESRRTRALLERNEVLAREAQKLIVEGNTLETQQDELEGKVQSVAERNQALAERANVLREERVALGEERTELEAVVQQETEELAMTKSDIARLKERKEKTQQENAELERVRNRLDENIARLERLRDEYMTAINRLKTAKDDMIGVAESQPTPSGMQKRGEEH